MVVACFTLYRSSALPSAEAQLGQVHMQQPKPICNYGDESSMHRCRGRNIATMGATAEVEYGCCGWVASPQCGTETDTLITADENGRYLTNPTDPSITNLHTFWQSQRQIFPLLLVMALDILSIPAMSAGVKRLSSQCKIMLTDRRNRMQIDGIEAVEMYKIMEYIWIWSSAGGGYWYRSGSSTSTGRAAGCRDWKEWWGWRGWGEYGSWCIVVEDWSNLTTAEVKPHSLYSILTLARTGIFQCRTASLWLGPVYSSRWTGSYWALPQTGIVRTGGNSGSAQLQAVPVAAA